jgi:hypothetical protein
MMHRRTLGLAFLAWEVWWTYVYVTAPSPDVGMVTVAAQFFGLFVPAFLLIMTVGMIVALRMLRKP